VPITSMKPKSQDGPFGGHVEQGKEGERADATITPPPFRLEKIADDAGPTIFGQITRAVPAARAQDRAVRMPTPSAAISERSISHAARRFNPGAPIGWGEWRQSTARKEDAAA